VGDERNQHQQRDPIRHGASLRTARAAARVCYDRRMCGRFTLTSPDLDSVAAALDAALPPDYAALYRPRYNIAPTDLHWIARGDGARRELTAAHWGLLRDGGAPLINVRSESAGKRFPGARRCIVPADGFYEWRDKRPYWFHSPEERYLFMAALYHPTDAGHITFTILTAPANPIVAPIHNRMPVLLPRLSIPQWLDGEPLDAQGATVSLVGAAVSTRVNSVQNDDPACLAPDDQLGLF
jgi:putative SOS response-associated peptidase YedK